MNIVRKMGRPLVSPDLRKDKPMVINFDEYQVADIDSACELLDVKRSELIRYFLFQGLSKIKPLLEHHADEDSPAYAHAVQDAFHLQRAISRAVKEGEC